MLFTVFDIETTGLNPSYCGIIQFSYVNIDENYKKVNSGCLHFYKSDMHWSAEAEAVHGISQQSLEKYALDFDDNIRRMYVILQRSNAVGHNAAGFDFPFCRQFLKKNGMSDIIPTSMVDTMNVYRPVYHKKMKLGELAHSLGFTDKLITAMSSSWFGGDGAQAHDSRWDATATALIMAKARREGLVTVV